jgi:hypothetical protein
VLFVDHRCAGEVVFIEYVGCKIYDENLGSVFFMGGRKMMFLVFFLRCTDRGAELARRRD